MSVEKPKLKQLLWLIIKASFHMIATIAAIGKKSLAIVAIMWKLLFSDRSDHRSHIETSLYGNCSAIKVAKDRSIFLVAITWKPAFTDTNNPIN